MAPRSFKACAPCRTSKNKCTIATQPTNLACQRCTDRGLPCSPEIIHIIRSGMQNAFDVSGKPARALAVGPSSAVGPAAWTMPTMPTMSTMATVSSTWGQADVGQWENTILPGLLPGRTTHVQPLTQERLQDYLASLGDQSFECLQPKAARILTLDAEFFDLQHEILSLFPEPSRTQLEDYPIPPLTFLPKLVALGCSFSYHGDYSVNTDFVLKWLYSESRELMLSFAFAGVNLFQESPIYENRTLYRVALEARLVHSIRNLVQHPNQFHVLPESLDQATLSDFDQIIAQLLAIQLYTSDLLFVGKIRQGVALTRLSMWMGKRAGILLQPHGSSVSGVLRFPTDEGMVAPEDYGCGVSLWAYPDARTDPWRWVRCETLRRMSFKTAHWAFLCSVLDGSRAFVVPEGVLLHTGYPQNDGLWEDLVLPIVPPLQVGKIKTDPDLVCAADAARLRSMSWMALFGDERTNRLKLSVTDMKDCSSFAISFVVLTFCARSFVLQLWARQHRVQFGSPNDATQMIGADLSCKVKSLGQDMDEWFAAWPEELKVLDEAADVRGLMELGKRWYGRYAGGRMLRHIMSFHELRIRVMGKVATLDHGELSRTDMVPWFPHQGDGVRDAMFEAIQLATYAKNMLAILNGTDIELRDDLRNLIFGVVPPLTRVAVIHLNVARFLAQNTAEPVPMIGECRAHAHVISKLLRCIAEGFPTAQAAAEFVENLSMNPDKSFAENELREMTRVVWPLLDTVAHFDD